MNLEELKKHISTVVAHPQVTVVDLSGDSYTLLPHYQEGYRRYSSDAWRIICRFFHDLVDMNSGDHNERRKRYAIKSYLENVITYVTMPKEVDETTVSVFMTKSSFAKKVPSNMKIGKYLKKMAPFAPDALVETYVNKWKDTFRKVTYTLHEGDNFAEVYNMKVSPRRGEITNYSQYRKQLADSCMQGKFKEIDLDKSPLNAYNSGDWRILYAVENPLDGVVSDEPLLGARVIISSKELKHSAVYGTNNAAIDFLHEELEKRGFDHLNKDLGDIDFTGYKLKAFSANATSCFLGPYLDTYPKSADLDDGEEFFIIKEYGEYRFCDTGGEVMVKAYCRGCGSNGEWTNGRYPGDDSGYCEDCYDSDGYDNDDDDWDDD